MPRSRIPPRKYAPTLSHFNHTIDLLSLTAFAPILLERKANRIRKEMSADSEKGGPRAVRSRFDNADRRWQQIVSKALVRPFKLFYSEPIVQLLGAYMAFVYGLLYRAHSPLRPRSVC